MTLSPIPATPHQALYRRWRAQRFDQMVGQDALVTTLRNAVRLDRLGHGFLFVGPRGTGKTSMARILAKAVNCTDLRDGEPCDVCPSCVAIREGRALDVVELDAASNNRVDDMRELLPRVYTAASDLRRKVFIIDEVQRIKEGWDVLLKTLEEPPEGVLFVFCTTDPSQIRPAVVSRLQRYTFRPLDPERIRGKLTRILEAEGRTAEPEAVQLIARLAGGGMRDAESMLDQVLGNADDPVTAASVRDLLGLAEEQAVDRFVRGLAGGDARAGIAVLDALEAEGRDLVAFAEQVVLALRARLVAGLASGDAEVTRELAAAARRLSGIDASRSGLGGYRWQLELALLAAAAPAAADIDTAPRPSRVTPAASVAAARSAGGAARMAAVDASPSEPPPATVDLGRPGRDAGPYAAGDQTPGRTIAADAPADPRATSPAAPPDASSGDVPAAPTAASSAVEPAAVEPAVVEPALADDLLTRVREGWPEVVAFVGRNPAIKAIIIACRPVEVRDGVVVLGFPEDQPFLREKAEQRRAVLEEGLQHLLGRPIGVRCVTTNVALPRTPEASVDLVAQARRIFEGDLVDVSDIS